jgi:release factor glutamine methyltransferase
MKDFVQYVTSKVEHIESVDEPRLEASLLIALALSEPRESVITSYNRLLSDAEVSSVMKLVEERRTEKPFSYISGLREFYGRPFVVSSATLIPRPATETLIDETLESLRIHVSEDGNDTTGRILELGTGTGCIIITLLKELNNKENRDAIRRSNWTGLSLDIQKDALKVAELNSHNLGLSDEQLEFCESNWCEALGRRGPSYKFDLVVSNPPYLTEWDWEHVPKTIKNFEPSIAFVGGADGLDCYRKILQQAPTYMKSDALLCLEIGAWQEEQVVELFTSQNEFQHLKSARDMDGHMRVVIFKRSKLAKKECEAL